MTAQASLNVTATPQHATAQSDKLPVFYTQIALAFLIPFVHGTILSRKVGSSHDG
jgi:hypothetical protein